MHAKLSNVEVTHSEYFLKMIKCVGKKKLKKEKKNGICRRVFEFVEK